MILAVTLNPAIDTVYSVDRFEVGKVFRPQKMWQTAGGKGINVARVASILGERVIATGFIGGNNGHFIRDQLKKLGIEDEFVSSEGETRICIAINDPVRNTSTEILESGPVISPEEQEVFLKSFRRVIRDIDIVALSGSLPRGIATNYYGKLIDICNQNGKKVILDTSGEALIQGLKHRPFMIKPNQQEIEALAGEPLTETGIIRVARELQEKGVNLVCVTLGAAGCIAVTTEGTYRLRTPAIKTINTVGSGDAFIAGCAVAFQNNQAIQDVLKSGMACGMANTQFAETGKVSQQLVKEFSALVTVEKLN